MSSDQLESLGASAVIKDVSAVEDSVVAAAEARASKAETEEHARLLAELDSQLKVLRKQERTLSSARFSTAGNRQLQSIRARIRTAQDRRTRLVEADEARRSIRDAHRTDAPSTEIAGKNDKEPRIAQGESQREFLIRTGKVTPFDGQRGYEHKAKGPIRRRRALVSEGVRHQFDINAVSSDLELARDTSPHNTVKRSRSSKEADDIGKEGDDVPGNESALDQIPAGRDLSNRAKRMSSESESEGYQPGRSGSEDEQPDGQDYAEGRGKKRKRKQSSLQYGDEDDIPSISPKVEISDVDDLETREGDEWVHNNDEEVELEGGLRIPASIYDRLFDYQKTGVRYISFNSSLHLHVWEWFNVTN